MTTNDNTRLLHILLIYIYAENLNRPLFLTAYDNVLCHPHGTFSSELVWTEYRHPEHLKIAVRVE